MEFYPSSWYSTENHTQGLAAGTGSLPASPDWFKPVDGLDKPRYELITESDPDYELCKAQVSKLYGEGPSSFYGKHVN